MEVCRQAAVDLQRGRSLVEYVREFAFYCWVLNADGSNDDYARTVAAALAKDPGAVTPVAGTWLVTPGRA
jgi:hypothetical protein